MRENNLSTFATRFGSDLDGTIAEKPKHSRAMVRVFRLRRVQRWLEDWMRNVQVIFSQVLTRLAVEEAGLVAARIKIRVFLVDQFISVDAIQ